MCAAASMAGVAAAAPSLNRSINYDGLRRGNSLAMSKSSASFASRTAIAKSSGRVTCGASTQVVISLSTGALLALGRFVFLPFQRDNVSHSTSTSPLTFTVLLHQENEID